MFNLMDRLYSWKENSFLARKRVEPDREVVEQKTSEAITTVSILPASVLRRGSLLSNLSGTRGTTQMYPVSALYHMRSDVGETLLRLEPVYQRALQAAREGVAKGQEVHLVGVSLGTALMSRVAQECTSDSLTLVVPGDRLGECALESSLTGPSVRKTPFPADYCEQLREYDPLDHVKHWKVKGSIRIFIGGKDLLIPGIRGRRLANKVEELHPHAEIYYWPLADHFMTMVLANKQLSQNS